MVPQTGLKGTGVLVPLTGPSDANTGRLIAAVSEVFGANKAVRFPTRIEAFTDPQSADFDRAASVSPSLQSPTQTITADQFSSLDSAAGLAVSWQIEGHYFGVPASIIDDLARGHVVVINVDRRVIPDLRAKHSRVHVIYVTANRDPLAGNSSDPGEIPAPPVTVIDNSGPLIEATEELRRVLETYIP